MIPSSPSNFSSVRPPFCWSLFMSRVHLASYFGRVYRKYSQAPVAETERKMMYRYQCLKRYLYKNPLKSKGFSSRNSGSNPFWVAVSNYFVLAEKMDCESISFKVWRFRMLRKFRGSISQLSQHFYLAKAMTSAAMDNTPDKIGNASNTGSRTVALTCLIGSTYTMSFCCR